MSSPIQNWRGRDGNVFIATSVVLGLLGTWVAEALLTHRDTYELNRELMAIRSDVPLDVAACNRPLEPTKVSAALHAHELDHLTPALLGGFSLLGKAAWRRPPPPAAPRR